MSVKFYDGWVIKRGTLFYFMDRYDGSKKKELNRFIYVLDIGACSVTD